ncbi:MAG: FAD-binding protein [Gemmatimonadaceae bacterium]
MARHTGRARMSTGAASPSVAASSDHARADVSRADVALAEVVKAAYAESRPLRIVGSGTWLHGGGPFADATPLSVRNHAGVVEYIPGDLVITVRAGTTLAELAAMTGEHGQTLALTPYGAPESTIGAVVATAASAPLALGDLLVRDLVLGLTVVTGTGEVVHAGGRVVKNVAGFDLVRMHTGAWGTVGVITGVSLRLHARPACDAVVTGPLTRDVGDVLPALIANRAPLPMLVRLVPGEVPQLWARVSGNAARAAALEARLATYGVPTRATVTTGTTLHTSPLLDTPADAIVLRLRTALSDAVPFVRAARDAMPTATLTFDPARGTLRTVIPSDRRDVVERDVATLYRLATQWGAAHPITTVVEQGRTKAATHHRLDAGVKRAFDPGDLLNRLRQP